MKYLIAMAAIILGSSATFKAFPPDWSDGYEYISPAGWKSQKMADHVRLEAPGGSCLILIFPPQRSSGDLEHDAVSVLTTMYPGWQFQKSGEQQFTLSKGLLPGGQQFAMLEAGMKKPSADGARYEGFEDGVALVVRAGSEIAIVAARHNASLLAHSDCLKYDRWRRFFNSFTVKNAPPVSPIEEPPSKRIIGRWVMSESGTIGEYLFAANGNYALVGALGSTYKTTDLNYEYLHIKTNTFAGDGAYAIVGNELTLRRRVGSAEKSRIRFEMVNHGGTGWKDRIYLLKRDPVGETEVAYERFQ
ncbi:MAG: hypothetical protein ACJ72Z_02310 [Pyrinomonadaceae bacterium]